MPTDYVQFGYQYIPMIVGPNNDVGVVFDNNGRFKIVRKPFGSSPTEVTYSGILSSQITNPATIADTAETDLYTFSLPAATLAVNGQGVRVTAVVTAAATATTKRLRLYFGATAFADTGALTLNAKSVRIYGEVLRTSATAQVAEGGYATNDATSVTTAGLQFAKSTPGETLANAITVKLTGLNGTANANDIVGSYFLVELIG